MVVSFVIVSAVTDGQGAGVDFAMVKGASFVHTAEERAAVAQRGVALRDAQVLHRAAIHRAEQALVMVAEIRGMKVVIPLERQMSDGVAAAVESSLEGVAFINGAAVAGESPDGDPSSDMPLFLNIIDVDVGDELEETFVAAVVNGDEVGRVGIGRNGCVESAVAVVVVATFVDDHPHGVELRGVFDDEGVFLVHVELKRDETVGDAVDGGDKFDHPHVAISGSDMATVNCYTALELCPEVMFIAAAEGNAVVGGHPVLAGTQHDRHDGNAR